MGTAVPLDGVNVYGHGRVVPLAAAEAAVRLEGQRVPLH
jgi:hypothetical protein